MTYKVNIKKDYKPKVEWVGDEPKQRSYVLISCLLISGLVCGMVLVSQLFQADFSNSNASNSPSENNPELKLLIADSNIKDSSLHITQSWAVHEPKVQAVEEAEIEYPTTNTAAQSFNALEAENISNVATESLFDDIQIEDEHIQEFIEPIAEPLETKPSLVEVIVQPRDNMAYIFKNQGLSGTELHNIMTLGKVVKPLNNIKPGQTLKFDIRDNELHALHYDLSLEKTLIIERIDNAFTAKLEKYELETVVKHAQTTIKDSLFLSGKAAGLSDNLIMQMVSIYGWDIDFALDIREGDSFTIVFEEFFKDGEKVKEGPILAAEFVNNKKPFRAVRYQHADGSIAYYSDNGASMRKAFLRTPVEFARISSRFNLKRRHPILNRIRAHKGVDYAAPTGTAIKATGDGMIVHRATKGGYGRTVILKHGGKYTTLYAHLSRYKKGLKVGSRVKQGQTIGYVGSSGLATGPHLHYEFRVHGAHVNPLTVKLPKADSIPKAEMNAFNEQINPLLDKLDILTDTTQVATTETEKPKTRLPLQDG